MSKIDEMEPRMLRRFLGTTVAHSAGQPRRNLEIMKSALLVSLPAIAMMASAVGCTAAVGQDDLGVTEAAATACPAKSATDDQQRAAATVAFNIMRGAAKAGGTMIADGTKPVAPAALAPQRFRVMSGGVGIEFDPTDGLYSMVTAQMKADLAIAQLDTTVAKFLSDGLNKAYSSTDGKTFPSIRAIQVLGNYTYPGPTSGSITDPTSYNQSHTAQATGSAWCGTQLVTINERVEQSYQFAPLWADSITSWRGLPPSNFKGSGTKPYTPFNGPSGNPYLVVSVNGAAPGNWSSYGFTTVSCYPQPGGVCTGTMQIDPVPYAEPGAYYNTVGLVGTQANPFDLSSTMLYAVPEHSTQWASRTVNSTQEWGQFSTALTVLGSTVYRYVKKM